MTPEMYGLPGNTDLSFLRDKSLLQVCIGFNEIILNFGENISITAHTDITHFSHGNTVALYSNSVAMAPMLVRFLHQKVDRTSIQAPGTLILHFSNNESLKIHDNSSQFESYQISHDGKVIVV